ncbi:MAG: erythronate-4-phosphate dehydrogenase [Idiomarina sp.]|nr:MAG: erythronate-4-phosphate dehydrogenase [Idiomarina sp.]
MHLLADASMPLVAQLAETFSDALHEQGIPFTLSTFHGRQPTPEQLASADLLMIRSITRVDAELLRHAPRLKWVGTATIGTEHVDADACRYAGVAFVSTPGVNANAVGDYVASAISNIALEQGALPAGEVAIIGAGHTGRAAGQRLRGLGLNVHFYDPPLLQAGMHPTEAEVHADWQRVLASKVISCHVPLTKNGEYPTYHLFSDKSIAALTDDCILINASRGAVVAEQALRSAKQRNQQLHVVLDVWENEPQIAADLLPWLRYATAHIAGHSVAGKVGGTLRLFAELAGFLKQPDLALQLPSLRRLLKPWPEAVREYRWQTDARPTWQMLASWVRDIYDIRIDDNLLRQATPEPAAFDALRRHYSARAELSQGIVVGGRWLAQREWQNRLQQLTFSHIQKQEQ